MRVLRAIFPLSLAVSLLVPFATASAHRPIGGDGDAVIPLPNITTSFAAYRDLESAEQVDWFTFQATAGEHLHAGINIPAVRGLEDYSVSVALIGPGLPAADQHTVPVEVPEGQGAVVFPTATGQDFFEPFTQTNYWGRQRIAFDVPATGDYALVVWQAAGTPGKYVLDVGTEEVFGAPDLFRFPIWWVQVHAFFGHTPHMIAAGALMALAGLWAVRRVGARRPAWHRFPAGQPSA